MERSGRGAELARYVAPAAFLVAATVAVLLIRSAVRSGDAEPVPPSVSTTVTTAPTTAPTTTRRARTTTVEARYTIVERGETLATIADEFDVTVERLLELNPGIDPRALTVGQRVRVR